MARYSLSTELPGYLRDIQKQVEEHARGYGLDFFPTLFEVVSYDQMNELAAYGGFPVRYPHWRFGMEYEQLSKSYEYGLSKIYEMVINNNPAIAYLLEGNSLVDQKLVMAHVLAHVDFFKNNFYFRATNQGKDPATGEPVRKWIDSMANHGSILRRWADRIGIEKIEEFVDNCLSLENLIDPGKPFLPVKPKETKRELGLLEGEPEEEAIGKIRVDREYMEDFLNPKEFVEAQKKKAEEDKAKAQRLPASADRDVLGFLLDHAPLERWERDVLWAIRAEAYYFWPQMQTKIMNEGWACVAPDTLVFTNDGLVPMREVTAGDVHRVSDGETPRRVLDQHVIADHETITLRTRRGLELTGSNNHRVARADGTWARLDALTVGDRVRVAGGCDLWPSELATLVVAGRTVAVDEDVALALASAEPSRNVPDCILRSPRAVVERFLGGLFGRCASLGTDGWELVLDRSTAARVQLLLLNLGVLSTVAAGDTALTLAVTGASAWRLSACLGLPAPLGVDAVRESWEDEVVALEHGRGEVHDITVESTHRYAAAGFVNHNSYWHSRLMTEKICDDGEIIEYAERNAGVMDTSSGRLNPYKLGVELYRHVEERWDKGQFGKEWEDCDDLEARRTWNRRTGLGRKKIFEVRSLYNDVTFIDEFLTPEFVAEQKLYAFGYNARNDRFEIETRKFEEVKEKLLFQITNAGQPFIYVEDANHGNRGELLLRHDHQGIDLRVDYAREVLKALVRVWRRPVEIHTKLENKPTLLRFDGKEHVQRPLK